MKDTWRNNNVTKDVLVESEVVIEIYKLIDYMRCTEMATGYKGVNRPNIDFISRKLREK